ncbi:MAG TPA: gliding motility-associated C-terminal domain-containing protein, partial [Puia sp.]|nr:gliding motility-associated C-terminal domain-containing protein [Puia sp.]
DSNQQILWQHDFYPQDPRFASWYLLSPAPARGMAALGNGISASGLVTGNFLKVDTTGVACSSGASALSVSSATTLLVPMNWDMNTAFAPDVTSITQDLEPLAIESRLFCPRFVTGCDTMRLEGPGVLCRLQDTATYILHSDPSCPDPITWSYDSVNMSILSKNSRGLKVKFKTPGSYFIKVEKNGCNVWADSIVVSVGNAVSRTHLPEDTTLCSGHGLVLDAGAGYNHYLWQDGSDRQSISVATPGTYWVRVEGRAGCISTDTSRIDSIVPLPVNFLPSDTIICAYSTLVIQTLQPYVSYLWSTGETTSSIQVKNSGAYRLQVVDKYGCKGDDGIGVTIKNCPYGIWFPNAFTPNNDGRNDQFRPVVTGNLVVYHFSLYNRWGQLIFDTTDPGKGWDGRIEGHQQGIGTYVWICVYQFAGDKKFSRKGNFTLIH